LAQLGIAAFYEGHLATATMNIGTALMVATNTGDTGGQIRYTIVVGAGYLNAHMYDQAISYFDKAIEMAKLIPGVNYQFLPNDAKVEALIGLKRLDKADRLALQVFDEAKKRNRPGPQAEITVLLGKIALAKKNNSNAKMLLQRAHDLCAANGFGRLIGGPEAYSPRSTAQKGRFQPGNTQLAVNGMLAGEAMNTVIVRTPDLHRADYGEQGFGPHLLEACLMTAQAGDLKVIGIRWFELQQLAQSHGPGLMHRSTNRCLDTLEIESASRLAVAENDAKQLLYFAGEFFVDRFGRFFSWADGAVSVTGRSSQIRSLTSNNCWPSSRKRRHSATSRLALAKPAGEEKVSVTVFPFSLRVSR
jgi:tetratricopeptide (TPR) repeat protein